MWLPCNCRIWYCSSPRSENLSFGVKKQSQVQSKSQKFMRHKITSCPIFLILKPLKIDFVNVYIGRRRPTLNQPTGLSRCLLSIQTSSGSPMPNQNAEFHITFHVRTFSWRYWGLNLAVLAPSICHPLSHYFKVCSSVTIVLVDLWFLLLIK